MTRGRRSGPSDGGDRSHSRRRSNPSRRPSGPTPGDRSNPFGRPGSGPVGPGSGVASLNRRSGCGSRLGAFGRSAGRGRAAPRGADRTHSGRPSGPTPGDRSNPFRGAGAILDRVPPARQATPPPRRLPPRPRRHPMSTYPPIEPSRDEVAAVAALAGDYRRLRSEIGKVIVGQEEVVEQLLTGLFARGHVLLVGVPGLAKTLLVSTVSQILSLSFRRIQFTPDMMPSDITGTDILQDDPETGRRSFAFIAGPLFANIILADEINRTPPKTQAALAGGDAGAARHRREPDLSAARPVLRPGHPEPDRAGGDLPPARGPARPVHAQRPGALPDGRRGAGDPPPDHRRPARPSRR